MSKRDYYEILEVTRTATETEIKSSYRRLAMKFHPDRNPGDQLAEEKFKECAEAYAILADAEKRGLPELKPLLEALAGAAQALRSADFNDDASGSR